MLSVYRFLINTIFLLSPIIILFRLLKKKENFFRFQEKIGFFKKKRKKGNLIWFHGASVGEIQSIVPLLEKFQNDKKIKQILITTNTLSSSKIVSKLKIKKIIHQFFPIDSNYITRKFINYWRPSQAFFIDSEIWPNTILNLKEKKIQIILLNARITKKSFLRWNLFSNFAKKIFNSLDLCLASDRKSLNYLKKLNAKKVKFLGNLKFSQSEKKDSEINKNIQKFFLKRKVWCASSTHSSEEIFCAKVHISLKKKIKNLLTIIIPRHVERTNEIKRELEKINLKVHLHEPKTKINKDTQIYLVNSYGKTKSFYKYCENVFLGGSMINHGGQNPLEAVRFGCKIFHGPNVSNFKEIFDFLKINKFSKKINSEKDLAINLSHFLLKKNRTKKIQLKLKKIGNKILNKTFNEINV